MTRRVGLRESGGDRRAQVLHPLGTLILGSKNLRRAGQGMTLEPIGAASAPLFRHSL